jgi:hypothetical protein
MMLSKSSDRVIAINVTTLINSLAMKLNILFSCLILSIVFLSCQTGENDKNDLQGTWQLLSETKIERGDTTFTEASKDQRMIKIINDTHFAFLRHDLKQGKDSAAATFVAGGGSYTLKDNVYTEELEFCNFREWENHAFTFNVEIKDDTLIQKGEEKLEGLNINRIIIEKYVRVSDEAN